MKQLTHAKSVIRGILPYAGLMAAMLLTVGHADAGTTTGAYTGSTTTGTEFDNAGQKFDGWIRGSYGKTIALGSSVVGLGAAGFTKSYIPAVWGLGIAAAAVIIPGVIGSFFTATI
jgi:hypothetical protein